jgi:hypothetical protein
MVPRMGEIELDYRAARAEIREDLRASHRELVDYLRRPGAWFTGAERNAIAREARLALDCALCRERKRALSPEHAQGVHATTGELPAALVDVIHRVRSDPGRLSRRVFETALSAGVSVGEYVEAVGIASFAAGLDTQCRALGIPAFPLADPLPGRPPRRLPEGLREGTAWVPLLAPEDLHGPESDLYGGSRFVPHIVRALSAVPDHVRALRRWSDAHYVALTDFEARRAIDRMQIELVAARVSALNQCFY